ncbi:MAG: HAD-IA family hydrolase [Thermodesulfovibrionales bacterium]|nr:HAD-IA family hydrolase [Thermodesulfovibrionales bacterium]
MPVRLIIFDLDGTLVDTSIDITRALNYAIKPYGLHELTVKDTIKVVGEGVSRLIEKVLGPEKSHFKDEALERFLYYYRAHLTDYSRIYPGVRETLEELGGYKKAVISNKTESLSVTLLDRLGLLKYFSLVVGGDSGPEKKPSPAPVRHVLSGLSVSPHEAIMVGDSNYDIEAGQKAGVRTVAVTYGYRERRQLSGADYMVDGFEELIPLLPRVQAERRKEKRHTVPDICQTYIEFRIKISDDFIRAGLLDFSRRGIRIKSPVPVDAGSLKECTISIPKSLTKGAAFKARVKHCLRQEEGFIVGAEIEEVEDEVWFRIVGKVHDFIYEKEYFHEEEAV